MALLSSLPCFLPHLQPLETWAQAKQGCDPPHSAFRPSKHADIRLPPYPEVGVPPVPDPIPPLLSPFKCRQN